MANFPGSLSNLAINKANSTSQSTDHPNHHNAMADEINAIEAELGTDPSGTSYATVKARLEALEAVTIVVKTADYTLALTDIGTLGKVDSASARVVTFPTNANVAIPVGSTGEVVRWGAGSVTLTPASGVTIPNAVQVAGTSSRTITSQMSSVGWVKTATNEFWLSGSLT